MNCLILKQSTWSGEMAQGTNAFIHLFFLYSFLKEFLWRICSNLWNSFWQLSLQQEILIFYIFLWFSIKIIFPSTKFESLFGLILFYCLWSVEVLLSSFVLKLNNKYSFLSPISLLFFFQSGFSWHSSTTDLQFYTISLLELRR